MSNSNFGSGTCQSHFYIPLQIDAAQGKVLVATGRVYKKVEQLFTASVREKQSGTLLLFFF